MDNALLAEAIAAVARLQTILEELRRQAVRRCDDCGRSAAALTPIRDAGGDITGWLGPSCHRRRQAGAERGASVQLPIAEGSDG